METKTLGELIVNDNFYVLCKKNSNYFNLIAGELKMSKDKKNHIMVSDDDGEITDLPCDESRYDDEYYIYTTDKKEFNKWHIPDWEKQIKEKEKKILLINNEIEELKAKMYHAKT